jgi:hypothetical protein
MRNTTLYLAHPRIRITDGPLYILALGLTGCGNPQNLQSFITRYDGLSPVA